MALNALVQRYHRLPGSTRALIVAGSLLVVYAGIHYTRPAAMALQKTSFGAEIPGYVGGPASRPAVIVLQEWWGITEEIKDQAMHLSKLGDYRVLVPDIYKGKVGVDAEEASHLSGNLDWERAIEELKAANAWLRETGAPKVGVTGFCMGGALSLLAAEYAGVDAAAPFYGSPKPELGHPQKINVPVQAHVGEEDSIKGMSDPETMTKFIDGIKAHGVEAVLYKYPGEDHAFMNSGEDAIKRMKTAGIPVGKKESQDLAWSRVQAFFKEHLG